MKSKIIKMKAFTYLEMGNDPDMELLQHIEPTRKKVIEGWRSYYGNIFDDPLKRGVICEVEVKITIPPMPKINPMIGRYIKEYDTRLGFIPNDPEYVFKAGEKAILKANKRLKKIRALYRQQQKEGKSIKKINYPRQAKKKEL